MKTRMSFLILVLMILPLGLVACGGGATGEAEDYVKAAFGDYDLKEAAKHVCEENKNALVLSIIEPSEDEKNELEKVECKEKGDDVECKVEGRNPDDEEINMTIVFGMKDGKVCEMKSLR